jgi:mannose-1-phosphate guanylyltransferase/mannose-6-phosphate isomerase
LQALILAGGSGTRFWPLSRTSRPKQLLALEGERSLLQETVERLRPLVGAESVWVSTTRALAGEVRRQLPEVPREQVIAEPVGRNTAPAIGWSVRAMPEAARRGVVAVLPADHRMADGAAFRAALAGAAAAAREEDRVMTLGVVPRWAETGYGYLELGEAVGAVPGVRRVRRFVEKPDASRAAAFLASGAYLWNAGIFVFRGATLLAHLARLAPELARGLEAMAAAASPEAADDIYARLPALSIDYAVMEKLDGIATVPLDCGWSDLGSWEALYEVLGAGAEGAEGNAVHGGETLALDARGNLLVSDPAAPGVIAVLGVSDLVVVRTADAVLVCPRERSQEVRRLVEELKARGRRDLL